MICFNINNLKRNAIIQKNLIQSFKGCLQLGNKITNFSKRFCIMTSQTPLELKESPSKLK